VAHIQFRGFAAVPSIATDAFDLPLWETFFNSTIGLDPVISSPPPP
jgi:hypothetical protein